METYKMIGVNDLQDFIRSFTSFIKSVLMCILSSVRKYLLLSVLLFVGVIALGIYNWYSKPAYYQADMVCEFNNLNRKTYGEMTDKLDQMAKAQSYEALAAALKLPLTTVNKIVSIEGRNIVGSPLYEDANGDLSPMYFTVKTTANTVFGPFQQAFISYLNSSPYRQLRNGAEVARNEKKLQLIYNDLNRIDSVITAYSNFLQHVPPVHDSIAGFSNIAALFSYKDQLEDKAMQLEQRSSTLSVSVEVLHGFVPPGKQTKNSKRTILIFICIAFAAAMAVPVLYRLVKESLETGIKTQ